MKDKYKRGTKPPKAENELDAKSFMEDVAKRMDYGKGVSVEEALIKCNELSKKLDELNKMKKIDTSKPVMFYDDRGREKSYFLKDILYENNDICLCNVSFMQESLFGEEDKTVKFEENIYGYKDKIVLFDKNTREVLTNNLDCYYAKKIKI